MHSTHDYRESATVRTYVMPDGSVISYNCDCPPCLTSEEITRDGHRG